MLNLDIQVYLNSLVRVYPKTPRLYKSIAVAQKNWNNEKNLWNEKLVPKGLLKQGLLSKVYLVDLLKKMT